MEPQRRQTDPALVPPPPTSSDTQYLSDVRAQTSSPLLSNASQTIFPSISQYLAELRTRTTKEEAILEKYPPPDHWRLPRVSRPVDWIRRVVFQVLCMISFGHADLVVVYAAIRLEEAEEEDPFSDCIRQNCERMNNLLLVAGLLVSSVAALLTTPPPRTDIVNYTLLGPYICFTTSLFLLLGGIVVGSSALIVMGKVRAQWTNQVLFATRFNIYCTIIVLSYPFFSIGLATLLLAFGFLGGIWSAQNLGLQIAVIILPIMPFSMGGLFALSCFMAHTHKIRLEKAEQPPPSEVVVEKQS